MYIKRLLCLYLCAVFMLLMHTHAALGQCSAITQNKDVTFRTPSNCAPSVVTEFSITYEFITSQNPADIEILFEWNDSDGEITFFDINNGLVSNDNNTKFTATGSHTYPENESCSFFPTAYVVINNIVCETSKQAQTAFSWSRDNEFGGEVAITPQSYDVCYNEAVTGAVFADNSFFNCNIQTIQQDHANRQARHVQFVYGTNHDGLNSIRNLTLNDGNVQNLTDGNGNLATTETRGAGLPVTGAYFGPVDAIPVPADLPASVTFPINAPADMANAVGNWFEITMYNWNICNAYNGDPLNPNYEDAIFTTAYIRIIDAPDPAFNVGTDFCIDEDITFENISAHADAYLWEFFDDASGSTLLGTSNDENPTFSFSTAGEKRVRLTAINNGAQGDCKNSDYKVIKIIPSLTADISTRDMNDTPITPEFCQNMQSPQDFDVRFVDISQGTVTTDTRWRWTFYDENNAIMIQEPTDGSFSDTQLGPFDLTYSSPGVYSALLEIHDTVTGCESSKMVNVIVYPGPVANFNAEQVCEGAETEFTDLSTVNSVNGEKIVQWEWDFNYDGTTFNADSTLANGSAFSRDMGMPGTYPVALRVTTDENSCSSLFVQNVVVNPLPTSSITADQVSGCGELTVNFTNEGAGIQADMIQQYIWELDNGAGFEVDSIQSPADDDFSTIYTKSFENFTSSDKIFDMRLKSVTKNGCETIGTPITITLSPGPTAGFMSLNYSPFDTNCSPVDVDFQVDNNTQALNPSAYEWTVEDTNDIVHQENTGTTPAFNFNFINNTQSVKNYLVTLQTTLPSGCSGDSTRIIRVNPVPHAQFSYDTIALDCDIMQVEFESEQKGLAQYYWEIRENGELTYASDTPGDNFNYPFFKNGEAKTVEVRLQTTNFADCESEVVSESFTVPKKENINTSFTATPQDQTLPDATVFIENTTNSGPWEYLWDFGDGQTSTAPDISQHTYATYGTYTIKLTVTYQGCIETRAITVNIRPIPPVVDFTYDPASGCVPLTVSFTNRTKYAEPNSYVWNFGDNQGSSKVEHPTFTYYEPGVYSVTLSATNAMGDTIREIKPLIIEVYAEPNAQFDVRPNVVYVPEDPLYTDNNSFGASFFHWDFGDGTTSLEQQPVHYYEEEGQYDITLIATSSYGCSDTTKREGIVQAVTGGNILVPNAFSPNLSGPVGGGAGGMIGTNDVFLPITEGVAEFEMLIYNRWGELLFQSVDKNSGWDGYYNGKLCSQDVYIYKLNLIFEDGRQATRMGDVNLIR